MLWIAAPAELRAEGLNDMPVPSELPPGKEANEYPDKYLNFSDGAAAQDGSWVTGPTRTGKARSATTTVGPVAQSRHPLRPTGSTAPPRPPHPVEKGTAKVKDVLGS